MNKQQIARIVETILRELEARGVLKNSDSGGDSRVESSTTPSTTPSPAFDCGQVLTAEKVEKFEKDFGNRPLCVPDETLITSSARSRAESLGVNLQTE